MFRILNIDRYPQHREMFRRLVDKVYPNVDLVEYDAGESGPPDDIDWSTYDLLVIDSEQGEYSGIDWLEQHGQKKGFPTTVFLSSIVKTSTMAATQKVIRAMQLGAENFYFKGSVRSKQLIRVISEAMEKSHQDELNQTAEFHVKEILSKIDIGHTSGEPGVEQSFEDMSPTDKLELITQDTQHEINLAMAVLHGHEEWPFSYKDIIAGRAKIGSYKILSYLSKGEYNTVFKAIRDQHKEPVILKLQRYEKSTSSKETQATLKIFDSIIRWKNPHVTRWLDYQVIGQHLIVAQEILESETLAERLARTGFSEDQAITFFRQMMQGMQQIHEVGYTLSDLRPENLKFRDSETLVITNLGVLRSLYASNQDKQRVAVVNAAYVSPEQAQGRTLDKRSDLYVAGVILYEMLAGKPPFAEGSQKDILHSHITQNVPLLPNPGHPINSVIRELMMKTPSRRIQTAEEAIVEVDRAMQRHRG